MRSTVGPNRTRRPRNANGSRRKGWTRSSDLDSLTKDKTDQLRLMPLSRTAGEGGAHARGVGGERNLDGNHPAPALGLRPQAPSSPWSFLGGRGKRSLR